MIFFGFEVEGKPLLRQMSGSLHLVRGEGGAKLKVDYLATADDGAGRGHHVGLIGLEFEAEAEDEGS